MNAAGESVKRGIALYIHIPFCLRRCAYCDFNAYADPGSEFRRRYHLALLEDLARSAAEEKYALRTVYIGGGTPSLCPVSWLAEILAACRRHFIWRDDIEVSIEANPGTVDRDVLCGLRDIGINRLSLGVQSLDDSLLALLGRVHDRRMAAESVRLAYKAGFANVSVDLMYGLPRQTAAIMKTTLSEVLSWRPQHISAYALSVEEGTPLQRSIADGCCRLPDEEEEEAIERTLRDDLSAAGYGHYEISNWCRPGFECRHNIVYWENGEYLGVGCGAVSYLRGWRFSRCRDPREYIACVREGRFPAVSGERLGWESRLRETMMLGMRTAQGIDLADLAGRFRVAEEDLRNIWRDVPAELVKTEGTRIRFTQLGWDLSNEVFVRYLM